MKAFQFLRPEKQRKITWIQGCEKPSLHPLCFPWCHEALYSQASDTSHA